MRQTTNYRSRTFTGKIHGPMGCEQSALTPEETEGLRPTITRFDDSLQLAFEIERFADGKVVVFLLHDHVRELPITPILVDQLMTDTQNLLQDVDHMIVSGPLTAIKAVLKLSMDSGFSVGSTPIRNS